MIEQKKMIGVVTWAPNSQACYVRVNIPNWETGIPLSIKATFSDFDRRDIEKGDVVEVERSDSQDARRFRVLRLMKEIKVPKRVNLIDCHLEFNTSVPNANAFKIRVYKEDRTVRFWISSRYANDPTMAVSMCRVLVSALEMKKNKANALMTVDLRGFWIICRESQFARFLIMRNEEGLPNLFQDLRVQYYTKGDNRPEIDVSENR